MIKMKASKYIECGKLRAEFVQTSKEMVTEWLGSMPPFQRNLKRRRLKMMIRAAREGRWNDTGEAFMFDSEGRLVNGQHRCNVFLAANFFPVVLVVHGCDFYGDLDKGTPRTIADSFKEAGIANYVRVSSVSARHAGSIEWANRKWVDLEHIMSPTNRWYVAARMQEVFGEAVTTKFFDGLSSGICPQVVGLLRKRLVAEANRGRGRMGAREQLAIVIKAANAFAAGRSLSVLKWVMGETFPKFEAPENKESKAA